MMYDFQDVTAFDYLQSLYGQCDDGNIVFVNTKPGTEYKQVPAYFHVTEIQQAADFIDSYTGTDLFMKVNVMDREKSLARSKYAVGNGNEVKAVVSIHLDVDAGKSDKYLSPDVIIDILEYKMPLTPSGIVQTNGEGGGFHAYWLLAEPLYISNDGERKRCGTISSNWLAELRHHAKPGTVDGTANLDRVLRPIGSLRKSGNRVRHLIWNDTRRYRLEDFKVPDRTPPQVVYQPTRQLDDDDKPIEKYLTANRLDSVEAILQWQGYEDLGRGFWRRPNSDSGAPTGQIYEKDGRQGFTVKSGATDMPLSCENPKDRSVVGNWYSVPALWVSFHCGVDASNIGNPQAWKQAAQFCKDWLDDKKQEAVTSPIEQQAKASGATTSKASEQQATNEQIESTEDAGDCRAAGELLDAYANRIERAELPQLLRLGPSLDGIEVGETLVTLIGAPPGHGKTALASQIMFEALEHNTNFTAYLCNAEMDFDALVRRELTRMTRIESNKIRFGLLTTDEKKDVRDAVSILKPRVKNLFVFGDPSIESLVRLVKKPPGLVVVDYLQKFAPPDKDVRAGVNQVMNLLRQLAKCGHAILALSATKRDAKGRHDSKELNLSSFKESGECEYQADSAYVLRDNGELNEHQQYIRKVTLGHVKNRHGAKEDRELEFHMPRMEFSAVEQIQDSYSKFAPDDDEEDYEVLDNPFAREAVI